MSFSVDDESGALGSRAHPGRGARVEGEKILHIPRLLVKAIIYNAFHIAFGGKYLEDYCEECRRAIDAARRHWGESAP
jgi:hypothetical protein